MSRLTKTSDATAFIWSKTSEKRDGCMCCRLGTDEQARSGSQHVRLVCTGLIGIALGAPDATRIPRNRVICTGFLRHAEMLGQLQPLALVIRRNLAAIQGLGLFGHAFVHQPTDDLPMFQHEGGFVATHLQHPT